MAFPLDVHVLRQDEATDKYQRICPTRGNVITTTPDHTNLLPDGDGFDLSVADTVHGIIWYRDVCPLDAVMTAFVANLPDWTQALLTTHADKQGYELAKAVWDAIFAQSHDWVEAQVADANEKTWIQNKLLAIVLFNWFRSQNYVHVI